MTSAYERVELQNVIQIPPQEQEFVLVSPPTPLEAEFKQTIMNRRVEFNISKYVHEGWLFTKYNLCAFFGIGLLIVLVSIAINVGYVFAIGRQYWREYGDNEYDFEFEWNTRTILITVAFGLGRSLLFAFPIYASMYKAVFNAMRNNAKIRFADFFSCFTCPYWFRLMGLGLSLMFLSCMGFFFWPLIFPGFYFVLTSVFAIPLHVEHSFAGVWNSMYWSFKIFHRYFCSMLAFLLLLGVMQLIGLLCFGVGLFVTMPVAFVSMCYAYHHLIGVNGVAVLVPTAHLEGLPAEGVTVPVVTPVASAPALV